MITFFTVPKPFEGRYSIIQRNAIWSWLQAVPEAEVLLIGNERGTADAAAQLGARHHPEVRTTEYGTPLLDSVFRLVRRHSNREILCYVNADIVFVGDFSPLLAALPSEKYLGVGKRWEIDCIPEPLWERDEECSTATDVTPDEGDMRCAPGIDFFVFSKSDFCNVPPFVLGRPRWDRWMIENALLHGLKVVDCEGAVRAIHQNHDYEHVPCQRGKRWDGPEGDHNIRMCKGMFGAAVGNATHVYQNEEIKVSLSDETLRWRIRRCGFYCDRLEERFGCAGRRRWVLTQVFRLMKRVDFLPGCIQRRLVYNLTSWPNSVSDLADEQLRRVFRRWSGASTG